MKTLVLKEQEKIEAATSLDFFAFTGKAPPEKIEQIRNFILNLEKIELIFQKRSADYLFICKKNPLECHPK